MTTEEIKEYLLNYPGFWNPKMPDWQWFIDNHCKHGASLKGNCPECIREKVKNV